jgi:hypothetical protein
MAAIGQDDAWAGPEPNTPSTGFLLENLAMNLFLNSI